MFRLSGGVVLLSAIGLISQSLYAQTFNYNFAHGSLGFSADFADYPAGQEGFFGLEYGFGRLPAHLATRRFALILGGTNRSDDLCMFIRRRVSGLQPNTRYAVRFKATIASKAPAGAIGIGGAPGESVFVKAGVSRARPTADPATRLLNIDKGNQGVGGTDAMVIGDVAVDTSVESPVYRVKVVENPGNPFSFVTNAHGQAWLFFATDSGFEGRTRIFVMEFSAEFTPVP